MFPLSSPAFLVPLNLREGPVDSLGPVKFYQGKKPSVALVLSGGGARGFAHIGVLKALEREGIFPTHVVGASMGSVIGGLYATGRSAAEIESITLAIDWKEIFSDKAERSDVPYTRKKGEESQLFEFRVDGGRIVIPTALTSGHRLLNFFSEMTLASDLEAGFDFDRLPRPFRAVATNLATAETVVLKKGSLAGAMRASMAVPLAFTPFELNERLLVDGGFKNILPVDVARELGAALVIAVYVRPTLFSEKELDNPLKLVDQVVAISLTRQEERPEWDSALIITPDLGNHNSADFEDIPALINQGEMSALPWIARIKERLADGPPQSLVPVPDKGLEVQSVQVKNLGRMDYNEVVSLFDVQPGDTVNRTELAKAARRVYDTGFFDSLAVEVHGLAAGAAVELWVREHPPVEEVSFEGMNVFSEEELAADFPLKKGYPANPKLAKKGVEAVLRRYRERGYPLAQARLVHAGSGRYRLTVSEGRIAEVQLSGPLKTRRSVVDREMGLRRGKIFSTPQMKKDVRNLYATGLFDHVYFTLKEKKEGPVVVVNAKEKPFEAFLVGVRYDNMRLLEGYLRFREANFAGRGHAIHGLLQYGLRREKYLLGLNADRLFETYLAAGGQFYFYRDRKFILDEADTTRFVFNSLRKIGGSLSLAHHVLKLGKISYVFLLEHYRSNQDPEIGPLKNYQGIRTISLRAEFDTYDHPHFPRRGYNVFSAADFGLDIIGKHDAYVEYTLTAATALSPSKTQAFLPAFYLSTSNTVLPDPVKNYLGGATDLMLNDEIVFYNTFPLYGFSEQAFTGNYLLVARLAYRLAFPKSIYLYLTANAGETWAGPDFTWHGFGEGLFPRSHKGVALTLAADIPFLGPASLSASRPLFSSSAEKVAVASFFYFSLGRDF